MAYDCNSSTWEAAARDPASRKQNKMTKTNQTEKGLKGLLLLWFFFVVFFFFKE